MAEFTNEIIIDKPIEQVFDFLAVNFEESQPKIDFNTLMVEKLTEGAVGKGTQFRVIKAKHNGEQDPSRSEMLKGLDLDSLDPELRKEIEEYFIEVTVFQKNKLFEMIMVSEDNQKGLIRYNFSDENGSTRVIWTIKFNLDALNFQISNSDYRPPRIFWLIFRLFSKKFLTFGMKQGLKDLKEAMEANLEPAKPENPGKELVKFKEYK